MDTNGRSRSRSSPCASPEFEFWMVRNPSFPQPNILSADQLFVNGVLLPLHLLNKPHPPHHPPDPEPQPQSEPSPAITDSTSAATPSKRWKDIFKKKNAESSNDAKKKEKKNGLASSAELNINIWPFSRSRSAGNAGTRPKLFAPAARKANSAPCSRSNSSGESKSKKWPTSPGRAGVHLGRSSPVWQVRRGKNPEPPPLHHDNKPKSRRSKLGGGSSNPKTKVLNLNVPMCMGYRHHSTCRSEENSGIGVRGASDNIPDSDSNSGNSNHAHANVGVKLFNLRSLFSKKSVVASH
ncbi:hypothetical protein LR48_Vigan01g322500 [Vigna angularis]|uniref:Uncharacterized protein n=2 Tax=Phaseolus angularis TaxID=3914 RepID=A0A0L9TU09_PHAAN|nr:uncharacterized protein LOC108336453 [Vigna angularis]KAG2407031.1 uncharacterized protein HKW66_Vig0018530 [Vigna angularis]KOM33669.1 hypothetical protein LR48_Vigan01g322500 [Vigna angularis]BAT77345.1 hypothetical protein VIGAN_01544600 [Vigna angularis var. angularis]